MKICLYYKTKDKPWGGANFFILNLKKFFIKNNITITYDINSGYDILFLNSAYKAPGKLFKVEEISRIKNNGYTSFFRKIFAKNKERKVKILYRVNGLRKVYANIESKMDDIQLQTIKYTDHIVFQSKFSYNLFKDFGYNGNNFSIIHNGVDQNIFNINNKVFWDKERRLKLIACSWSDNPAKGHKIIADFSCFRDIEVQFVGNWNKNIPIKNVKIFKPVSQQILANFLKQADIFLFPSLNESCSNLLLEALSCGLPVLYVDSGSNEEIAGKYGIKIDLNNLRSSLETIKLNFFSLLENIIKDINKFSIDYAGRQYLEVCKEIQKWSL